MNKPLMILFFFAFCTGKKDKVAFNTVVRLKLAPNLPFKKIQLNKFDPVYGNRIAFDYGFSRVGSWFECRFSVSEPTALQMIDENKIGAGALFVHPNDSLCMEISWPRDCPQISHEVVQGRYPVDNVLVPLLFNTVLPAQETAEEKGPAFADRKVINDSVEAIFKRLVSPLLGNKKEMATSAAFEQHILNAQIELLKCNFKNGLLRKSPFADQPKFYADTLLSKPSCRFWNNRYWEYNAFRDYLFYVLNKSKATDLPSYVQHIEDKYGGTDAVRGVLPYRMVFSCLWLMQRRIPLMPMCVNC